ncbi:hypothetical protein AESSP_01881 [Aestuariimicrobium sp. T2.26MG-19.2B]|nr:hypothetical protein AESSP_01881 [Aestuariimicrobium sp. T2.26MG-19.2B]
MLAMSEALDPSDPRAGGDADVVWLTDEQQQIWRAWLHGVARVNDELDAQLRTVGLDLGDYEILVSLVEGENRERRMSDLAAMVHQSRSRLTHAINRMETNGWVIRRQASDDRRGVIASLTDEGYALLERAAPGHVREVRRVLVDAVDPDDFVALGRCMQAILAVPD